MQNCSVKSNLVLSVTLWNLHSVTKMDEVKNFVWLSSHHETLKWNEIIYLKYYS